MTAWMTGRTPADGAPVGLVDVEAAGGVDLGRLERALELRAERVGLGRYAVRGGAQEHWVDLATAGHPRCDCGDHLWREAVCKHILAALLREGDARVLAAVGRLMARLREGTAARAPVVADAPAPRRAA